MKRLYKCDNCIAFYENKKRAINCHYGDVVCYVGEMNRKRDYWKRGKR